MALKGTLETNDYNGKRIGNLLCACGLPVGKSKDTIKEVCEFCKGAYLLVGIGTRMNDYLGKNENYVKFYGKTKNGSKASTLVNEPKQEEEISDDMLPFQEQVKGGVKPTLKNRKEKRDYDK